MPSATPTLFSSTVNLTDRSRIDEANQQNVLDMASIGSGLYDTITQGLGLYNQPGSQDKFNTAFQNSQDALNNYAVQPGNVDLSNYQPYMDLGRTAAAEAGALAGFNSNGQLVLAPGGVDVRPGMSSQDVYSRYLNNPAVQAEMDLGNRQISANAAAKGLLGSGSILKSLQSYGQGVASRNIGQAQENLYKLAGLGAQSANQYAASLLNKYSTDQQSALAGKQNQTALIGQQANLLGTQQQGQASQLGFLSQLSGQNASLQAQAALQRQSSLAGSATTSSDVYGLGFGGTRTSINTKYNGA